MRESQNIYNDIGSVLLSIAPDTAEKIILCATLDPESDCGEFSYDYIDKQGNQSPRQKVVFQGSVVAGMTGTQIPKVK